jgi:outer membrane protein
MRTVLKLVLIVGLATASTASATSFANRGLGLGLGFMKIFRDDPTVPDFAIPLWLEGSYYTENGIDVYVRIPLALASVPIGAPPNGGAGLVFAIGGQFGLRYLFLEETVRPFVSLHLSGIYVVVPMQSGGVNIGSNLLAGPGVGAGLEVFVFESVSLQARGFLDWFVGINCGLSNCQRFNVGGTLTAATYF